MEKTTHSFSYELYNSIDDLPREDAWLLQHAREATSNAYAPYSKFFVGAAARLKGSNQENASYPVGICAERVLLSATSALYPGIPIDTMAVSYDSQTVKSDHPITPCGICRQTFQEYEHRWKHPIRLILSGQSGKVIVLPQASLLLPLSFSAEDMI
jgi:cytidine deaminase